MSKKRIKESEDFNEARKMYNGGPKINSYPFRCHKCAKPALVMQKGEYLCAVCYMKENFPDA